MVALSVITAVWNIDSFHRGTTRWVLAQDSTPEDSDLLGYAEKVGIQFALHKSWLSASSALVQGEAQVVEFVPDETHGHRFHPLSLSQVDVVNVNGTGGIGSSPQVAYRITLRSGTPGRSYRGRQFFPSIPEDKVGADGSVDSGAVAACKAFTDGVITDLNSASSGDSGAVVVPSFLHGTVAAVVDTVGRLRAGTQRRRMRPTLIS